MAHISLVLSSGRHLDSCEVSRAYNAAQLKMLLRSSILPQQLLAYSHSRPPPSELPPAAFLRSSPSEPLNYKIFETRPIRLCEYRGNELKDSQNVAHLRGPICVLGGSDVVTTCCDVRGKVDVAVINIEEEVIWKESEDLRSSGRVIEIVFYGTSREVFLCSGYSGETVQSLKNRLSSAMRIPENTTLWHQNAPLKDENLLKACGLRDRSRIFLQFPGDKLGLVKDIAGLSAIIPILYREKATSVLRTARIMQPEWKLLDSCTEYRHLCSASPQYSYRPFYIGPSSDRFITIKASEGCERLAIPTKCTVKQVKARIEAQYGLPAPLLSLSAIVQLVEEHAINTSGLVPGDLISVTRNLQAEIPLTIKVVMRNKSRMRFKFVPSTRISHVKDCIRTRRPGIERDIVLWKEAERLDNEDMTLAEYGICEYTTLLCGNKGEMLKITKQWRKLVPTPLKSPQKVEESPLELFDSGKVLNQQPAAVRFEEYLNGLKEALYIRFISPKTVIFLYVSRNATVEAVKSALVLKIKIQLFSLIWQDKALIEGKSLCEQGVLTGDTVLIEPAGAIRVNMSTPAGTIMPIVLETYGNGINMSNLIGKLSGIPANQRRITYTKQLIDEDYVLPSAYSTLYVSLKLGQGREHTVRIGPAVTVRVETDRTATAVAIKAELQRFGVVGEV